MARMARLIGTARSLAMYYGIPFRARRLERLYAPFVTRDALCFDIGAHAGNRALCWRRLGARVVAVEPQPDFVRLLRLLYGRDEGVTTATLTILPAPGTACRRHASDASDAYMNQGRSRADAVAGHAVERLHFVASLECQMTRCRIAATWCEMRDGDPMMGFWADRLVHTFCEPTTPGAIR